MKALEKEIIIENKEELWPSLPFDEWRETNNILHLWTQILGKIKLEYVEYTNHWWNITFTISATGFTTGIIQYKNIFFEIEFNFIVHKIFIKLNDGRMETIKLRSGTIVDFYNEVKDKLKSLGIKIHIWTVPVEIDDRLPFDQDFRFRKYDPIYANKFWKCLVKVSNAMSIFRSGFRGKASPIHLFWGALDLAVTFFSGKPAPKHPGIPNVGKQVMEEAYNAELASFGFWGGEGIGEAAFYAYSYPEPDNFKDFNIEPKGAYYNDSLGEFILPYSIVMSAEEPEKIIVDFYKSAFSATRNLGDWDKYLYKEVY